MAITRKQYIWGGVILALILLFVFRKRIARMLGLSPDILTRTASSLQRIRARAQDINTRTKNLIDSTNSKLRAIGSDGVIAPSDPVQAPAGVCKCWGWGPFGFWSKKCCDQGARYVMDPREETILNEFKSKATPIQGEAQSLKQESEVAYPDDPTSKEKKCPCWCIQYWFFGCWKSSKCCDEKSAGA